MVLDSEKLASWPILLYCLIRSVICCSEPPCIEGSSLNAVFCKRILIPIVMKNVMTYVTPTGDFRPSVQHFYEMQIDNALELGWKREDIILATNFDFEYAGIRSRVLRRSVPPKWFIESVPGFWKCTKVWAMLELIEDGDIDCLSWFHDGDAFQVKRFENMDWLPDFGLTHYGWQETLCSGSMFFRPNTADVFKDWIASMYALNQCREERAGAPVFAKIPQRWKWLDISFNFGSQFIPKTYLSAEKPLRVIHFYPTSLRSWRDFCTSDNELGFPLAPEWLISLFRKHKLCYTRVL